MARKIYMNEVLSRTTQSVQLAWKATEPLMTETVSYKGDILTRLARATRDNPLTLFVPWGVRPEGQYGRSEQLAFGCIQKYQQLLTEYGIPSTILVMPADVYAIEINNYPWETTVNYFNRVTQEAKARNFQVKPWSVIRSENQDRYQNILLWEANPASLWPKIPKALWYRDLLSAAYRRSKQQGDQAITKAAFDYLKERIAEARIIETIYRPIKLSMVSPKKDDFVDCDLPRLYILPKDLRYPWIRGGSYYEE